MAKNETKKSDEKSVDNDKVRKELSKDPQVQVQKDGSLIFK